MKKNPQAAPLENDDTIHVSVALRVPVDIAALRESAADSLSEFIEEFDVMMEEVQCEPGSRMLLVGIRDCSTTGFDFRFDSATAQVSIPPMASRADFLYAVAFAHELHVRNMLPEEFLESELPVCASLQQADAMWESRIRSQLGRLRAGIGDSSDIGMEPGIDRGFYYDRGMLSDAVPEKYRVAAFMRMFAESQWRFFNVGGPMLLTRKFEGYSVTFALLENVDESCVVNDSSCVGILCGNRLKLLAGSDFIRIAQWMPYAVRLDCCQIGIRRMPDEEWRRWWDSIPAEPFDNFSSLHILRRDSETDGALMPDIDEWTGIVDSLNRGLAYLALPKGPSDKRLRAGDMLALYMRYGSLEGIMGYCRLVACKDMLVMQPYMLVNPRTGAFMLKRETLQHILPDVEWGDFSKPCQRMVKKVSGVFQDLVDAIIGRLKELPNVIPPEGEHVDFALFREEVLPMKEIEASPYLRDPDFFDS